MPAPARARKATAPNKVAETKVDVTVENQENPGAVPMVDRNPGPQVVTDPGNGLQYDISKATPELVVSDNSEEFNRIRQQQAALNPIEWREDSDKESFEIYFVNAGLSTSKVWKKGETLKVVKGTESEWMTLSASEQEERYGRVMFEKR